MDIEMIASLGLGSADTLAERALAAATAAGVRICVAVVDRGGQPLVFKRHPGAPLHSIDIALDKAYTAVSFGRPTAQWNGRVAKGSEMLRHGLMHRSRFVGFGGIGISGGSEAQDVAFAEAALAAD